jgi:hypothetical protein
MVTESKLLENPHYVPFVIGICLLEGLKDTSFDLTLLVELLLVPEDFDSDSLSVFVVVTVKDLTERAFTDLALNFVSVGDVVLWGAHILVSIVVEAIIIGVVRRLDIR